MKKEQFTHNLKKAKRLAKEERNAQLDSVWREMFSSWIDVYEGDALNIRKK